MPRLASAPTARTASAPPAAREGSGGSDRAPEDRSRVQRLSPSEIEQRWRSPDPDDRDAAVDGLEALADNALAVALLQQWIVDSPLRDAPAWDALDALDPQLKVDAGAGMLFSPGREQTAAVRLLAGDRWREAYQVLREILATTDANHESHGGLIARGLQSIGDGARPPDVGRELRHDIVADRPEG